MNKLRCVKITKSRLKAIEETSTGLNVRFEDVSSKKELTLKQAIKAVEKGNYPDLHVVERSDGIKYIRSNPDGDKRNNLEK